MSSEEEVCERSAEAHRVFTHISTDTLRAGVAKQLSRDPQVDVIDSVELHLDRVLPDIDKFAGIFAVDDIGVWWYDGDGHIDDPIWRQRVIPWRFIIGITIHQAS